MEEQEQGREIVPNEAVGQGDIGMEPEPEPETVEQDVDIGLEVPVDVSMRNAVENNKLRQFNTFVDERGIRHYANGMTYVPTRRDSSRKDGAPRRVLQRTNPIFTDEEIRENPMLALNALDRLILECVASGMTLTAAALKVGVSYETVKSHLRTPAMKNALRKVYEEWDVDLKLMLPKAIQVHTDCMSSDNEGTKLDAAKSVFRVLGKGVASALDPSTKQEGAEALMAEMLRRASGQNVTVNVMPQKDGANASPFPAYEATIESDKEV